MIRIHVDCSRLLYWRLLASSTRQRQTYGRSSKEEVTTDTLLELATRKLTNDDERRYIFVCVCFLYIDFTLTMLRV